MITTLNLPAPPKPESPKPAPWDELRSVFPIYLALAKHLQIEIPFPQNKRVLPDKADPQLHSQVQQWLDSMDQQVQVHQLRHLLQMTTLNASESGLRALIMRHLRKPSKSTVDRDKIDFLLVQYFALCAPAKTYHKQIELADVAQVMKPVLGEVDCSPLSWCEPLEKMIVALRSFRGLRDILKTNFIEQGRKVKEGAGGMFYDPSAMIAFVRFNFLLRRTLIELMHADLIYIRAGINHLESSGAKTVDCQTFGLSSAASTTSVASVRLLTSSWLCAPTLSAPSSTSSASPSRVRPSSRSRNKLPRLASRQTALRRALRNALPLQRQMTANSILNPAWKKSGNN